MDSSPCLKLGQHGLDALRFRIAVAGLRFDKQVRVHDQIFQRMPAAYHVGAVQDVLGGGRHFVHVQMNHVGIQKINVRHQLRFGVGRGVRFAQHEAHQAGDVLVLVGNLEGEITNETVGLLHDAGGQVVQKIRLAAVGHSGDDDKAPYIGGVEDAVRQRSVTDAVAVVVFTVQHADYFVLAFGYGDDIRGAGGTSAVDDAAYHFGAIASHYVAYVLAVARKGGEKTAGIKILGKMFGKGASGAVGVAADYDVLHLVQPRDEGFETFAQVACRAGRYADDIVISRFHQYQHVLASFGDDESGDGFLFYQQRVDAVDVIRSARRGGRVLTPEFAVRCGFPFLDFCGG